MKGLPKFTARQTRPTLPGDAVNSPANYFQRTRRILPGALLFIALASVVGYSAATDNETRAQLSQRSTIDSSEATTDQPAASDQQPTVSEEQEATMPDSQSSSSDGVSTSIVSNNGQTTVTVNGEAVVDNVAGAVSKTINTDNGSVQIDVNQQNGGNNNTSVNTFSSQSSSSWNYNSETHMGGN